MIKVIVVLAIVLALTHFTYSVVFKVIFSNFQTLNWARYIGYTLLDSSTALLLIVFFNRLMFILDRVQTPLLLSN